MNRVLSAAVCVWLGLWAIRELFVPLILGLSSRRR